MNAHVPQQHLLRYVKNLLKMYKNNNPIIYLFLKLTLKVM